MTEKNQVKLGVGVGCLKVGWNPKLRGGGLNQGWGVGTPLHTMPLSFLLIIWTPYHLTPLTLGFRNYQLKYSKFACRKYIKNNVLYFLLVCLNVYSFSQCLNIHQSVFFTIGPVIIKFTILIFLFEKWGYLRKIFIWGDLNFGGT